MRSSDAGARPRAGRSSCSRDWSRARARRARRGDLRRSGRFGGESRRLQSEKALLWTKVQTSWPASELAQFSPLRPCPFRRPSMAGGRPPSRSRPRSATSTGRHRGENKLTDQKSRRGPRSRPSAAESPPTRPETPTYEAPRATRHASWSQAEQLFAAAVRWLLRGGAARIPVSDMNGPCFVADSELSGGVLLW